MGLNEQGIMQTVCKHGRLLELENTQKHNHLMRLTFSHCHLPCQMPRRHGNEQGTLRTGAWDGVFVPVGIQMRP